MGDAIRSQSRGDGALGVPGGAFCGVLAVQVAGVQGSERGELGKGSGESRWLGFWG